MLPPTAVQLNSKTVRRDLDGEIPEGTVHRLAGRAKLRVGQFRTCGEAWVHGGGEVVLYQNKNRGLILFLGLRVVTFCLSDDGLTER